MPFTKLSGILAELLETDEDEITPKTALSDALDSLQTARLVIACEKKFRVTIFDEDVHGFKTAGDLAAYIEARRDEAGIDGDRAEREKSSWYYR